MLLYRRFVLNTLLIAIIIGSLAGARASMAVAASPSPSQSQDVPLRLAKPLQHDISVQLKLVQVYVTDGKGRPVSDLNKEDFTIYDNGKAMSITEFERHVLATPPGKTPAAAPAAATTSAPAPAPTASSSTAPAAGPAPSIARKFLLFFDFANNNQRGARKSRDAALHFLDTEVRPGDEVGLISYSLTRGLSFHEFLTPDHARIRAAVADMEVKEISGRGDEIEQEYWRQVTEGGQSIGFGTGGSDATYKPDSPYSWKRQETKSQASNFLLKLTALAQGLRYVPGQKLVILFSSGIPNSLIYGNQAGTNTSSSSGSRTAFDTGDQILKSQNEAMLKELAAANCTMYAFDVREASMVPSLFAYDEETFDNRSHRSGRDLFTVSGVQQNNDMIYRDDRTTGLYSLRRLAKTTGGKYYSNIDRFEANLDDLQSMTSAFYVLGYSVSQGWNGEFHSLRVEVKRKGVEVRAQAGYYDPKPFPTLTPLEKELHLLDLAVSETPLFQAPLPASLTPLSGPIGSPNNLVLLGELPPAAVEKLSGTKAEMVTFVFDERGGLAELRRSEFALGAYRGRPIYYASQASLPPGAYKCRWIVRDLDTGEAAAATAQAFVPGIAGNGIRLHTPLILGPAANGAYLESRASRRTGSAVGASWADLYPFDASKFMPLLDALPQGTPRIGVVLPCSITGLIDARIAVRAAVVNVRTAEKLPLMMIPLAQTSGEGTVVQTFEVQTADLPAGRYIFYFYAQDTVSKALAYTTAALTVR